MFIIEQMIYYNFDTYCQYALIWLLVFITWTLFKLITQNNTYITKTKLIAHKENLFLEELPGLLFITLHSICFYKSESMWNKIIYLYWGPLYFITAYLVVFKYKLNWKKIAIPSSIACKLMYVMFVGIFYYLGRWLPIYMYSVWIMHDQIRLAWFKNNADRTRRLFEDGWIPRIRYPMGLIVPFYYNIGLSTTIQRICCIYSTLMFIAWILGIGRLVLLGIFFVQPKIEGFGRDIIYL